MTTTELLSDFAPALKDPETRFLQSFSSICEKGLSGGTRAIITHRSPDRMGDIVESRGARLENYKKNPIVLFGHDPNSVVGGCEHLEVTDNDIRATVKWAGTSKGQELRELYTEGFMRGWSVGFKPHKYKPIKNANGDTTGLHFLDWELLEFSAVSIPANAQALTIGKSLSCDEMRHGLATNHAKHFDEFDFDESIKELRLIRAAGMAYVETMFRGRTKILRYLDHDGIERTVIQHS